MKLTSFQTFSYLTSHHHQNILNTDTNSWNLGKVGLFKEGRISDEVLQVSVPSLLKTILILHQLCTFITLSIKIHSLVNSRVKSLIIMEPRSRDLNWISTGGSIRYRPRFFDQVGHHIKPHMHLLEIGIFSLYHVIVRSSKILNRADKNWAHF